MIVTAAFKQWLAALLYRCFTLAKVCSTFAVHNILCWLLEQPTSTALATLERCATKKVNSCSAVAVLCRSYGYSTGFHNAQGHGCEFFLYSFRVICSCFFCIFVFVPCLLCNTRLCHFLTVFVTALLVHYMVASFITSISYCKES